MSAGDDSEKTLGIDANKLRIISLIIISLVAASIVSFTGIIGSVSPHPAGLFIGANNRFLIPVLGAFGVTLVLISDLIGRTIIAAAILQAGVVIAFLGGPLFLCLLIRQKKEAW